VGAHIREIAGIAEPGFEEARVTPDQFRLVAEKPFPTLDDEKGAEMQNAILRAKEEGDSVGGIIECAVVGLPAGIGAPDFGENVEGIFAQHLFAVPAVKGVAFGEGFGLARLKGSQCNDPIRIQNGEITLTQNKNGGVNGGITNGMPVVCQVAIRPTPSISKEQNTIDLETLENDTLVIKGRHDPCVVHRAVPVIEAAVALATCELLGI
jgi:chorismate synthase